MTSDLYFGPELVNFIIGPHVIPALRLLVSGGSKPIIGTSLYENILYKLLFLCNL